MAAPPRKHAELHRMMLPDHACPFGRKSLHLLRSRGYEVEDHWLTSRGEVDEFKERHGVKTTPQTFIDGHRIGGYDDLRRHFGLKVRDPKATTYQPVAALFAMTALVALAITWAVHGTVFAARTPEWFVALSMCVLAMLKLQDIESFSSMFLNYDLLAQRRVPYAYLYPFIEGTAGVLMLADALPWLSIPLALLAGGVGAVSVVKAVYIDRRTLKCACVGGGSNVPLGFVSLTENLMMVGMAVWMLARH